jgi:hypothetical protein
MSAFFRAARCNNRDMMTFSWSKETCTSVHWVSWWIRLVLLGMGFSPYPSVANAGITPVLYMYREKNEKKPLRKPPENLGRFFKKRFVGGFPNAGYTRKSKQNLCCRYRHLGSLILGNGRTHHQFPVNWQVVLLCGPFHIRHFRMPLVQRDRAGCCVFII